MSENTKVASAPQQPATLRQLRYLLAVAREAGIDSKSLDDLAKEKYGVFAGALSRKDATDLIDYIQTRRT